MALTVVDTGVLIAVLDRNDAHHVPCIEALRQQRDEGNELILPASAYAEILVAPHGRGPSAVAAVDSFLNALPVRVEPVSRSIASLAARLRAQHRALRLPDALVIATALDLKAEMVLTTDRRWPKVEVTVRVV